jgi:hypothetical protein
MSSRTLTTLMKIRGLRNWLMLKGLSFSGPAKIFIVQTRSSPIVSPRSTEAGGTPTSNMPKPAQISHPSVTPPLAQNAQDQELQESTERRSTSTAKESQVPEPQDNRERRQPSPAQDLEF